METKELLKKYAIEKFNSVENKKAQFGALQNYILPAMLDLIEDNWKFMTNENIDRVLLAKYKFKVADYANSSSSNTLGVKVFDDKGKNIFGKQARVVVGMPVDLFNRSAEYTFDNKKFSPSQADSITKFFIKMNGENYELNTESNAEEQAISRAFFDIIVLNLKHEMAHTMSKHEIAQMNNEKKLNHSIAYEKELSKRDVLFVAGGIVQAKVAKKNFCGARNVDETMGLYFHEGITEYIAFKKARTQKIPNLFPSFGLFGNEYVDVSYAPYVWTAGAINALSNDLFLEGYFKGYSAFEDSEQKIEVFKKMYESLFSQISDLQNSAETLNELLCDEAVLDAKNELKQKKEQFKKMYPNLNCEELVNRVKKDMGTNMLICLDKEYYDGRNATDAKGMIKFIAMHELHMNFVLHNLHDDEKRYYQKCQNTLKHLDKSVQMQVDLLKQLVQNNEIDEEHCKEYLYCLNNLLDYKKTWQPLMEIWADEQVPQLSQEDFNKIKEKNFSTKKVKKENLTK